MGQTKASYLKPMSARIDLHGCTGAVAGHCSYTWLVWQSAGTGLAKISIIWPGTCRRPVSRERHLAWMPSPSAQDGDVTWDASVAIVSLCYCVRDPWTVVGLCRRQVQGFFDVGTTTWNEQQNPLFLES